MLTRDFRAFRVKVGPAPNVPNVPIGARLTEESRLNKPHRNHAAGSPEPIAVARYDRDAPTLADARARLGNSLRDKHLPPIHMRPDVLAR